MHSPKPWFRAFNSTWYVQVGKRQVPLAKGKTSEKEAYRRFYELMVQGQAAPIPKSPDTLVAAVCETFLDWSSRHNEPKTYEFYQMFLQDFCNHHGVRRIADLIPNHVTQWLDGHSWNVSTRRCAITAIKRALNWAVDEGLIPANPLKSVKKPAVKCREAILTPEERLRLEDTTDTPFRLFLLALRHSGARPCEVRSVTAAHVDLAAGTWTLPDHKTKHKTDKLAREKGRLTIWSVVDALTQVNREHAFAGSRSEADAKAASLLALAT